MTMPPRLRKLALTAHIAFSLGWTGALAGFLALAVAGIASANVETARSAYVAMDMMTRYVIIPLALLSLLSGTLQALATPWALFRHYWVLFKLLIAGTATYMLLVKAGPIGTMARAAADPSFSGADLVGLRYSILGHAIGGILVLLWTASLGVFKPRGVIRRGWKQASAH
jgi:hypothetical protein